MSIIENVFFPLKEVEKIRNEKDSRDLLREYIEEYDGLLDFRNHKKAKLEGIENAYRFTSKLISLDLMTKLSKDKRIKNVFYAASAAPPGGSVDSISMRFKVFVQYH